MICVLLDTVSEVFQTPISASFQSTCYKRLVTIKEAVAAPARYCQVFEQTLTCAGLFHPDSVACKVLYRLFVLGLYI